MTDAIPDLQPSAQRVAEAARHLGLDIMIIEMAASTRTAEEASHACACEIGQIVKSLVFKGRQTGAAYLFLVSGVNRVDEEKASSAIGEPLIRPDAAFVRAVTGYAIGGIPPFGHDTRLPTFIDEDLLAFESVWAAAGTPRTLFSVGPRRLAEATDAIVLRVC